MDFSSKNKAFSLIETSIVLIIIGVVLSGGYITKSFKSKHDIYKTKNNFEKIQKAINLFVIKNNRLPCPAIDTNGIEQNSCSIGTASYGILPYKSLELSRGDAIDGFDVFIDYVVDTNLTQDDSLVCSNDNLKNIDANIEVRERDNQPILDDRNKAGYVLISHGSNKYGGMLLSENRKSFVNPSTKPQEVQNSPFGSLNNLFYSQAINNIGFDDFIFMETPIKTLSKTGCAMKGEYIPPDEGASGDGEIDQNLDDFSDLITTTPDSDVIIGGGQIGATSPAQLLEDENGDSVLLIGRDSGLPPIEGFFNKTCIWIDKSLNLTNQTLKLYFDFQFFPGEANRNQRRGTGDGFVATIIAGNTPLEDEFGNVLCGSPQSYMAYQMMNSPDGLLYNPDFLFDIKPSPKIGIEFDNYLDFTRQDPRYNHVAFLNAYSSEHASDLNPICPENDGQGGVDKNRGCVHRGDAAGKATQENPKRTWLENQTLAVGETYGFLDNPIKTKTYPVRVELKRRCLSGCEACGQTTNPDAIYGHIKAYIDCEKASCKNLEQDYSVVDNQKERTIDYCYKEPLRPVGEVNDANYNGEYRFDTVKVGFTMATTSTYQDEIGVLIRNLYVKSFSQ